MECFYCNKKLKVPGLCIAVCGADGIKKVGLLHFHFNCFEEVAGDEIFDEVESTMDELHDAIKSKDAK